jgi:hypothetical protein
MVHYTITAPRYLGSTRNEPVEQVQEVERVSKSSKLSEFTADSPSNTLPLHRPLPKANVQKFSSRPPLERPISKVYSEN